MVNSLLIQIEDLKKQLEKKDKKIKELEKTIKSYTSFIDSVPKEEEWNKVEQIEKIVRGKVTTYNIKRGNNIIKFGDLLFYNKNNNEFLDPYGKKAKKYTMKNGTNMYYIASGVALNEQELEEIING